MQSIKIIKTLDYLHPLFIPKEGITVFAKSFSEEILKAIDSVEKIEVEDIKFSEILKKISSIKSSTLNKDQNEIYQDQINDYKKVELVETEGEFSVKGDIINIWPFGYDFPIRMEFFGEDCELIYTFETLTGKKIKDHSCIVMFTYIPADKGELAELKINYPSERKDLLKIIFTKIHLKGVAEYYNLVKIEEKETDYQYAQLFFSNLQIFEKELDRLKSLSYEVIINSNNINQLHKDLHVLDIKRSKNINLNVLKELPAGFISESEKFAYFTDREIFGTVYLSKVDRNQKTPSNIQKLLRKFEGEIEINDFVVHEDYGVGQYVGLKQEIIDGQPNDYLNIKFDGDDELFVPLTQIKKITKYLYDGDLEPKLTRLSSGNWLKIKSKVKKETLLTAKELIEHYAKREISNAAPVTNQDSEEYTKFLHDFEFTETSDQARSAEEVINDLTKNVPMDRLLVGDVGFGKTEVIMRAAFKIVEAGGQVAVLSPTTILTAQHYKTFIKRFSEVNLKGRKVNIKSLSRFQSAAANTKVVEEINNGKVDIAIGTHRLLSNDVKFKNLQLLVVDEEQKFGVKQKEKIKKLNYGVHVLSVSATPIPRTLSLALSSIQDISIITTPPKNREAIETEIIFQNWEKAANKIQYEISRGGQVYFIHNRIETIDATKTKLKNILPGIKFETAHGQMSANKLDKLMYDFYHNKFDCLICTTIIENGLDISNVNTIIINDAHRFGLSQLYQMRGRVGRSNKKAYCYLMTPKPTKDLENQDIQTNIETKEVIKKKKESVKTYMQRLESLVQNQELGAGFKIASRDLEIRGAGSILGKQQHGHIYSIGYALYIEMLAEAVEKVKSNLLQQ